jgi:hypothetical protein
MAGKNSVVRVVSFIFAIVAGLLIASPQRADAAVDLSGTFEFNHTPISTYTDVTPAPNIYDETAADYIDPALTYNNVTGAYTLAALPTHTLSISGYITTVGTIPTMPGNFALYTSVDLAALTPAERADHPIPVTYLMHMTSPWDNNLVEFPIPSTGTYPEHPRHIEVLWDAVTGAAYYIASIDRYRDSEHSEGYGFIERPYTTTTAETAWSVDLANSAVLEHYQLGILAYNAADELLGNIVVNYTNGYGADYRFKVLGNELILNKMTVKAGKTDNSDSFTVSGWLDGVDPADFVNGDTVTVQLGDLPPWTITGQFKQSGSKPKYRFKGTPGVSPSVNFDLDKETFSISGKNMNLTSLAAPVRISLYIGDYAGWADAEDTGDDDVINGKKILPIQLLDGVEDALRVEKATCKENTQTDTVKTLNIQGGITIFEDVDLSTVAATVYWGSQPTVIPVGGLVEQGSGKFHYVKKATQADPSTANITFDLPKCTFKIILTHTAMPWLDSPLPLRIVIGSVFDEQDTADF